MLSYRQRYIFVGRNSVKVAGAQRHCTAKHQSEYCLFHNFPYLKRLESDVKPEVDRPERGILHQVGRREVDLGIEHLQRGDRKEVLAVDEDLALAHAEFRNPLLGQGVRKLQLLAAQVRRIVEPLRILIVVHLGSARGCVEDPFQQYNFSRVCLKNAFRKMCVTICGNDFSNTL